MFRLMFPVSYVPSHIPAFDVCDSPLSAAVPLSSLHVIGARDILVDPARSLALSTVYREPTVVHHAFGHFVPDRWPVIE